MDAITDLNTAAAKTATTSVTNNVKSLMTDVLTRIEQGQNVVITSAEDMATTTGLTGVLAKAKADATAVEAKAASIPFATYLLIANFLVLLGVLAKLVL